jgi:hypothetical protein
MNILNKYFISKFQALIAICMVFYPWKTIKLPLKRYHTVYGIRISIELDRLVLLTHFSPVGTEGRGGI